MAELEKMFFFAEEMGEKYLRYLNSRQLYGVMSLTECNTSLNSNASLMGVYSKGRYCSRKRARREALLLPPLSWHSTSWSTFFSFSRRGNGRQSRRRGFHHLSPGKRRPLEKKIGEK